MLERKRERQSVCLWGGCISRPCNFERARVVSVCVWTKLVALMVEMKCLLICTLRATLSLNARALLFQRLLVLLVLVLVLVAVDVKTTRPHPECGVFPSP